MTRIHAVRQVPLVIEPDPDDPDFANVSIDVTIAGRPYRLLLDTGAARTQLHLDEYTKTLPPLGQASSSAAFGSQAQEPVVTITDLTIGPLRLETLNVRRSEYGHSQVLGMDVLGQHRWDLRLAAGILDLDPSPGISMENELTLGPRGHIYVEASWPGVTARACLDTGAGATVLSQVNSTLDKPMDLILGYPTILLADWLFDFPARRWTVKK
jgi:hypothetical protein